jgi:hypothetical protein
LALVLIRTSYRPYCWRENLALMPPVVPAEFPEIVIIPLFTLIA